MNSDQRFKSSWKFQPHQKKKQNFVTNNQYADSASFHKNCIIGCRVLTKRRRRGGGRGTGSDVFKSKEEFLMQKGFGFGERSTPVN
mmetsp:Transcript_19984/g.27964  ORF Transcript_19984/g.27964 Transcript_19984/m.27964 type:complete len:86 (-) Transcript_19984:2080-2337(-)